ncbi:MAG: DUF393 domain-containing protein [Bacteroidetes bacterium]|nr:DUF393 domain-containing protein [Bacteroidota bacterium]
MNKNIIFYDGECGLCNRSVQFILKYERNQKLQFAALKSSFSKTALSDFNLKFNLEDSILFFQNGKLFSKSKAVLRIIPFLKWYFYPLLICWLIPNFIRDLFYDLIARNRKKVISFCELPESKHSKRFLN